MTDKRIGNQDAILCAIRRLPPRSGIIVRLYDVAPAQQQSLIRAIRRIATARRHQLLVAGASKLAVKRGYDGIHLPGWTTNPPRAAVHSMAVHNRTELARAIRFKARMVVISPVHPTRSHSDGRLLGVAGFAKLAAPVAHRGIAAIALGGITAARWPMLRTHGAHGWAAIDAWFD